MGGFEGVFFYIWVGFDVMCVFNWNVNDVLE